MVIDIKMYNCKSKSNYLYITNVHFVKSNKITYSVIVSDGGLLAIKGCVPLILIGLAFNI